MSRQISDDELGTLVWCAISWDRRLPRSVVPAAVWESLSDEWKDGINRWRNADTDHLGAEVRPYDAKENSR
jgi:hypothetical protein